MNIFSKATALGRLLVSTVVHVSNGGKLVTGREKAQFVVYMAWLLSVRKMIRVVFDILILSKLPPNVTVSDDVSTRPRFCQESTCSSLFTSNVDNDGNIEEILILYEVWRCEQLG